MISTLATSSDALLSFFRQSEAFTILFGDKIVSLNEPDLALQIWAFPRQILLFQANFDCLLFACADDYSRSIEQGIYGGRYRQKAPRWIPSRWWET
ncbi:MAG TPA: hypothetical protein DIV79_00900 [Opitutae bacterium]|nr:hypothetical protein [Opitutaceae bacterium]HCR28559.1 hypothetical protein [Opitutae bacterium]